LLDLNFGTRTTKATASNKNNIFRQETKNSPYASSCCESRIKALYSYYFYARTLVYILSIAKSKKHRTKLQKVPLSNSQSENSQQIQTNIYMQSPNQNQIPKLKENKQDSGTEP